MSLVQSAHSLIPLPCYFQDLVCLSLPVELHSLDLAGLTAALASETVQLVSKSGLHPLVSLSFLPYSLALDVIPDPCLYHTVLLTDRACALRAHPPFSFSLKLLSPFYPATIVCIFHLCVCYSRDNLRPESLSNLAPGKSTIC